MPKEELKVMKDGKPQPRLLGGRETALPELKPFSEPAISSKLPEPQADKQLQVALLETIAIRVPFSYEAVAAFYDHYKSYDLLLAACEYAVARGLTVLLLPPAEYI